VEFCTVSIDFSIVKKKNNNFGVSTRIWEGDTAPQGGLAESLVSTYDQHGDYLQIFLWISLVVDKYESGPLTY